MDLPFVVGLAAGFLTTIAFVPQVAKIWKTRSAKDVSLRTFLAFTLGVGLWLVYGILKQEVPIIAWNAVTLVLAGAILAMKIKFG
ncbi:MAG TPA: SemiSWEET transporter [Usitatibacter sp.]|nr:SemiSWEET transporter [Usitatibacter sp.]